MLSLQAQLPSILLNHAPAVEHSLNGLTNQIRPCDHDMEQACITASAAVSSIYNPAEGIGARRSNNSDREANYSDIWRQVSSELWY